MRWVPGDPCPARPRRGPARRRTVQRRHAQAKSEEGPSGTQWLGDPTETALVLAAHAGGLDKAQMDAASPACRSSP